MQGQLQPHYHLKARSLSRQLLNGLLSTKVLKFSFYILVFRIRRHDRFVLMSNLSLNSGKDKNLPRLSLNYRS